MGKSSVHIAVVIAFRSIMFKSTSHTKELSHPECPSQFEHLIYE